MFSLVKNIVNRYGVWKIILGLLSGFLLILSIYPEKIISIIITSKFKIILFATLSYIISIYEYALNMHN